MEHCWSLVVVCALEMYCDFVQGVSAVQHSAPSSRHVVHALLLAPWAMYLATQKTPALPHVLDPQTRLLDLVGAAVSTWPTGQAVREAHCRSVVLVF